MPDFLLPDLGEGLTEAEIDRWLVKEGDLVEEDDPLVEVITDKATAEIPSPFAGVVRQIHVQPGQVVPVGTALVTIGEAAGAAVPGVGAPAEVRARDLPGARTDPDELGPGIKAMPPVRKLARELGVDILTIAGSGPGGRILRQDVEAAANGNGVSPMPAQSSPPAAQRSPARGGRREPIRGVRRIIAQRMTEAHRIVPQVTHVEECDVTELDATRKLANERAPGQPRLTYMPFIVKAVVTALRDYPALNASLDDAAGEIVFHDRFDIGIAVDTPAGLTVPVVRDADKKRLRKVAADIDRLADAARSGALSTEDLRDATFTISSPGPFGGLLATPIVFHPQSAILGVHRATDRAVVREGQIVVRKMMNLSISFDHRILDGMTAAKFVLDVVRLLEHPAVLALEA
jgi:pyruvate/2-oxoglutarate dehydrogenase complex dihydrolipoamide acyltransferase (E2) component